MGDFDIFNFLYALAAFVIGAAAILGAMLALMSVFPIQKIDNRESMLCQRLNEMVSIASQNVITLDEFMMRRLHLMNVVKSYKQNFEEGENLKSQYVKLVNNVEFISASIQFFLMTTFIFFTLVVPLLALWQVVSIWLWGLIVFFLVGIGIKVNRTRIGDSLFDKITHKRREFLKSIFIERNQIQYPQPPSIFYPCFLENSELKSQLPSIGEKLDILSMRSFSVVSFMEIHENFETVAGDPQRRMTKYYIGALDDVEKYGIQSYVNFYVPVLMKMNVDLTITVQCNCKDIDQKDIDQKDRTFKIKVDEWKRFYKDKDYCELVLRSTIPLKKIDNVMVEFEDTKITFWYKNMYSERPNILTCYTFGWSGGTYCNTLKFNYVDSLKIEQEKQENEE